MFRTIDDIKTANRVAGMHFFDADTLRFFNSRILDGVYGGRYFVTSERRPRSKEPRLYTVREASADGGITTVGMFQGYVSAKAARRAAEKLAGEVNTAPTANV
jgi:hypothetical protein